MKYPYDNDEPVIKPKPLKTDRKPLKVIILTILTLGIYDVFFWTDVGYDVNKLAKPHDGEKSMNYVLAWLLGRLTYGIFVIVWAHKISGRIGRELERREIAYEFSASTYWLWCALGSLILVGPIVYIVKACRAMNLLSEDYNKELEQRSK